MFMMRVPYLVIDTYYCYTSFAIENVIFRPYWLKPFSNRSKYNATYKQKQKRIGDMLMIFKRNSHLRNNLTNFKAF